MSKKKQKTKKVNEEVKNHQLQERNKQEIIAEYLALEKKMSQKEAELTEKHEEVSRLQSIRDKYITAMKVLEDRKKQNENEPVKIIASLQSQLIEHEEKSKEQMKKIVDYKISTTAKQTEIKKLKESAKKTYQK